MSGFERGRELDASKIKLTIQENYKLLALATSKVWEARIFQRYEPLFADTEEERIEAPYGDLEGSAKWQIIPLRSLWQEASRLTIAEKAARTLRNLAKVEEQVGQGVRARYAFLPSPGQARFDSRDGFISLQGLAYGCVDTEIPIVINRLRDQRLIEPGDTGGPGTTIHITHAGYEEIEKFDNGLSGKSRSAFLVCRFTSALDKAYESIYSKASLYPGVGCTIERVKDVVHIGRIDQKILDLIREAAVVLVDLTEANFNVGYEAGYAAALGKPIVFTRQKPEKPVDLPFDVKVINTLEYELNSAEEFIERLGRHLVVALDQSQAPK